MHRDQESRGWEGYGIGVTSQGRVTPRAITLDGQESHKADQVSLPHTLVTDAC